MTTCVSTWPYGGAWRTAGRRSASRRHVDHSAWTMLRGPVWPGQRAPASEQRMIRGHDGQVDTGSPSAEEQLGTAAVARRAVGSARVAAGEPRLVGRRRRRLPDRARRGHRRRRLRLVPGGPAGGRRAPAGRRVRAPRPGGRLRVARRARAGSRPRARGRWVWTCRARCCDTLPRSTPRRASLFLSCRPAPSGCPSPTPRSTWPARRSARCRSWPSRERVMREVARVLRPGGRWVFAVNHPMRWMFSDDPGPDGLTVTQSYFDRTPYVEVDAAGVPTYVEHHRTLGDRDPRRRRGRSGARRPGRARVAGGPRDRVGPVVAAARCPVPRHGDLRLPPPCDP